MNTQLVNIIFGMKVKQGRAETGMTVAEFAARCDLSPSYVTEIEKGRKYPRSDKIMRIAEVIGKSYDELVSIRLEPPLTHLGSALSSPVLGQFPFEEFGIELSDLMGMLTRAPDKASALLHAVVDVGRQFNLQEEYFLRAALRSYQELHENYFQDLEDAAEEFAQKYELTDQLPIAINQLERIAQDVYRYELDYEQLAAEPLLSIYRSVLIRGSTPKLLLNADLHPYQLKFQIARELGYQFLNLTDRAYTSRPEQVDSFQQVLNDFKASYFAGALLMPRHSIIKDIEAFFERKTWSPQPLIEMMTNFGVSAEALLYRFSELVPQYFGVKLHFLRIQNHGTRFQLVKQLNMDHLRVPTGLAVNEHFCRRWLLIRLIRELKANQQSQNGQQANGRSADPFPEMIFGVQNSEYLDSRDNFLCFGFARPLSLAPHITTSSIIGFRIDSDLKHTINFVRDPAILNMTINETCERCSLTADQCTLRAAEPEILIAQNQFSERKQALRQLMAKMRA